MGRKHSEAAIKILNLMRERGSIDHLEAELALGIQRARDKIDSLRNHGYVAVLPKEAGKLKRYRLTRSGEQVIGGHLHEQKRLSRSVMTFPVWTPPTFNCPRPGAMQAFALPSRGVSA